MANPAFDAVSTGTALASNSLTISHTCTGSNLELEVSVQVGNLSVTSITGVTYNGVAMTPSSSNGTTNGISHFVLANPATGANNIVISLSNSTSNVSGIGVSYTGVGALNGTTYGATGNSVTSADTNTTSATGETVTIGISLTLNTGLAGGTSAKGHPLTIRGSTNVTGTVGHAFGDQVGEAGDDARFTVNVGATWLTTGVSLQPAAAVAVASGNLHERLTGRGIGRWIYR